MAAANDVASVRAVQVLGAPRWSSIAIMTAISIVGMIAFLYPFFLSDAPGSSDVQAHANDAPLVFGLLALLAAVLLVLELASQGMNAKVASVLAVLATCTAGLRLIPLPAGASAFFFLIICGGYVFGPRFGMLLGATALFLSAFPSGGLGPWVPYQMFACGWLGLAAGWLGALRPAVERHPKLEVGVLAAFGGVMGFLYGALMNIWFWPYIAAGEHVSWVPGMGIAETLQHYWAFYVLTSFGWDAWAAIGNVVLIAIAGGPVLRTLRRASLRFIWWQGARAEGNGERRAIDGHSR